MSIPPLLELTVGAPLTRPPFVRKVRLRNYRSIKNCDVELSALTFLVGHNGAGKSNFVDSLRFITDALRTSLDHALRDRGGINEVRRRSTGHPNNFGIRVDFTLADQTSGHYAFRIGARPGGAYEVQQEECRISGREVGRAASFKVESGKVTSSAASPPAAVNDRLYLVNASGLPEFRPLYDALSHMGFYSLNPDRIRDLQSPDPGDLLARDGSNIASVLARMAGAEPQAKALVEEYLARVVDGIRGVEPKSMGPKETLEFRQTVPGVATPWRFYAANMSDGTLRALGILVALYQGGRSMPPSVPLVGIEEPEVALHPAAAGVLLDALRDASRRIQVLVTSHSPDLLDNKDLDPKEVLSVVSEQGVTRVAPLHDFGLQAMKEHLYTAGELLRMDQLGPAEPPPSERQARLFDPSLE